METNPDRPPCRARQEYGIIGYTLLMSLIEYKTLVMREDYDGANSILPTIPQVQPARRRQCIMLVLCTSSLSVRFPRHVHL